MAIGPALTTDQNILPVQAYFNLDGSFNTFLGQGQPFVVSATESIGIIDTTASGTFYPTFSAVNTGQVTSLSVTSSKLSFNPSTGVLTANGGFVGSLNGIASTATNLQLGGANTLVYQSSSGNTAYLTNGTTGQVLTATTGSAPTWTTPTFYATVTDDTTTNATRYPLFANQTSGSLSTEYTSSTKYQYNPSTGTLSATVFSGSGASLTSIPNAALTNSSITVGSTSISLGGTATTIAGLTSVTSTTFVGALTGNASTATSATTATNATNIAITDNTSSVSTYYPVLSGATTGNNAATTSSTKLSFVPNTGTLSATVFSGSGASLTSIPNGALSNSTISGVALGGNLFNLTAGTNITFSSGTTYNGSAAITINASSTMVYPGSGIPNSTGSAWGTSYSTSGSGTVVALATSASLTTPAITGGTIDNTVIGGTTPAAGTFTTLTSSGTATLANGSTTYVTVTGDASYPMIKATGGTNTPLVLSPLGTGALQAQKTDSTATGGNARGANAVDWQTARGAASQVASGTYASIAGGIQNTASGYNSTVVSGYNNQSTGYTSFVGSGATNVSGASNYTIVVGGQSNTAAGYYNIIGGGFTNSGTASAAVTTQSSTMNGTTAVTLSGSNANIKVGQYITGTSIAGDTYVAAISGTSLTLSKNASGSSTSTLSFYTPHGVVVGGGNNQATGSYSFIGGGGDAGTAANRNVASGDWSFVGGGIKNTASGVGAVICGGGNYGSGASANASSGTSSFVAAGWNNNASANGASILGGVSHIATSTYSAVLSGAYGTTRGIVGNTVLPASSGPVGSNYGYSQSAVLILGRQTTDATATVLTSDTSAASGTNQVILPNNSAYYFKGAVIAGVAGAGDTKGWSIEGVIKRGAGVGTTALVGTPTVTSLYADAGAATWAVTATADTTNGGLKITVTGQASTTIRWVCELDTTEMTY